MKYGDYIYEKLKEETKGLDSIYEDYIIHLAGHWGLMFLKAEGKIEACGVVNGRQLYVLCDAK